MLDNEKDLEALNKVTDTSCLTKDDLKEKAINDLMFGLLMLATVGLNPNIKREDLSSTINKLKEKGFKIFATGLSNKTKDINTMRLFNLTKI